MRSPWRWRGAAPVVLTLIAGAVVSGCGEYPTGDDTGDLIDLARGSRATPVYWVGESFEGLPLAHIGAGRHGGGAAYGTCDPPPGEGGCFPPLQIQTLRMCRATVPVRGLDRRRELRGVPAGSRAGAIVLVSRTVEVRVWATGGGLGLRAVAAMRAVNPGAHGAAGPGEPLPRPRDGDERRIPCSATESRPGPPAGG